VFVACESRPVVCLEGVQSDGSGLFEWFCSSVVSFSVDEGQEGQGSICVLNLELFGRWRDSGGSTWGVCNHQFIARW
jgi:hypothetical protein